MPQREVTTICLGRRWTRRLKEGVEKFTLHTQRASVERKNNSRAENSKSEIDLEPSSFLERDVTAGSTVRPNQTIH